jgi:hypothetical protein
MSSRRNFIKKSAVALTGDELKRHGLAFMEKELGECISYDK